MAVGRNSVEMCQRLVDQGAFPDAQTKWGESPAHSAARLGFLEMLKFLYQYCDANLYIASPVSNIQIILILKSHVARIPANSFHFESLLFRLGEQGHCFRVSFIFSLFSTQNQVPQIIIGKVE